MKTKFLGFVFMFSLLFNVGLAQESLLDDESADTGGGAELFSDDFFSDLDSFLDETPTAIAEEPSVNEIAVPVVENSETGDDLQSSALAQPGVLPASAQVRLTAINISQDDQNAQVVGARPGDVLAYTISLNSENEDVVDFVPVINVSNIASMVEFTDTGFGVLEGGNIIYPAYSHTAPCTQEFTFFVRVLDQCVEGGSLQVSSSETGGTAVNLNCGLTQTGPTQQLFLLLGLVMLMVTLFFTFSARSKN